MDVRDQKTSSHIGVCRINEAKTDKRAQIILVFWVGEGTGAGLAVIRGAANHTVKPGSAAFAPIALRVVLTVLHPQTHSEVTASL